MSKSTGDVKRGLELKTTLDATSSPVDASTFNFESLPTGMAILNRNREDLKLFLAGNKKKVIVFRFPQPATASDLKTTTESKIAQEYFEIRIDMLYKPSEKIEGATVLCLQFHFYKPSAGGQMLIVGGPNELFISMIKKNHWLDFASSNSVNFGFVAGPTRTHSCDSFTVEVGNLSEYWQNLFFAELIENRWLSRAQLQYLQACIQAVKGWQPLVAAERVLETHMQNYVRSGELDLAIKCAITIMQHSIKDAEKNNRIVMEYTTISPYLSSCHSSVPFLETTVVLKLLDLLKDNPKAAIQAFDTIVSQKDMQEVIDDSVIFFEARERVLALAIQLSQSTKDKTEASFLAQFILKQSFQCMSLSQPDNKYSFMTPRFKRHPEFIKSFFNHLTNYTGLAPDFFDDCMDNSQEPAGTTLFTAKSLCKLARELRKTYQNKETAVGSLQHPSDSKESKEKKESVKLSGMDKKENRDLVANNLLKGKKPSALRIKLAAAVTKNDMKTIIDEMRSHLTGVFNEKSSYATQSYSSKDLLALVKAFLTLPQEGLQILRALEEHFPALDDIEEIDEIFNIATEMAAVCIKKSTSESEKLHYLELKLRYQMAINTYEEINQFFETLSSLVSDKNSLFSHFMIKGKSGEIADDDGAGIDGCALYLHMAKELRELRGVSTNFVAQTPTFSAGSAGSAGSAASSAGSSKAASTSFVSQPLTFSAGSAGSAGSVAGLTSSSGAGAGSTSSAGSTGSSTKEQDKSSAPSLLTQFKPKESLYSRYTDLLRKKEINSDDRKTLIDMIKVEGLLRDGTINVKNMHTALTLAVEDGPHAIVQILLEEGADVNPDLLSSPLYRALRDGRIEIAQSLLEKGAKLSDLKSLMGAATLGKCAKKFSELLETLDSKLSAASSQSS